MAAKKLLAVTRNPVHPGEVLTDELAEIGMSYEALARILKIPAKYVREIVRGKRHLSADTAVRLARYFGTSAELWMNLQTMYDLDLSRRTIGGALDSIPQRRKQRVS
jgi:addiction module HigA family antidote